MLHLEGKVSIPSIAVILKEMGYPCLNGGICELLQRVGNSLTPNISEIPSYSLMINSDEIFAKEQPILVTIEPYSMAILRMELTTSRTADDWKQYWTSIKHEGIEIGGLCSDQGKGIIKGFSDFNPKLPIFPDHFYHFRALVHKVEKGAFNDAIKALREERRLPNCWNREAADQDVTLYDDHHYLLQCILEILPFLSDQG